MTENEKKMEMKEDEMMAEEKPEKVEKRENPSLNDDIDW